MPNTPTLALPYPAASDTADVPRDIQALATKLDGITGIAPPLVTSLPVSPVDGQEILYQADATNGVLWHLRYRSASASTYKWEFLGGPELNAEIPGVDNITSTVFADAATVGPQITAPLAGDYDVFVIAALGTTATANAFIAMSYAVGATDMGDNYGASVQTPAAGTAAGTVSRWSRATVAAAGTLIKARYRVSVGTGTAIRRSLRIRPVRVG